MKIKNIKVKPLEIAIQTPIQNLVFFRKSAIKDIQKSLDKILKTKIEEKVTEGSEDEEIDMWTRLKPDPRNLEKAQKIEEEIFNKNPTVEDYYKNIGKIVVLLDILDYESARYSIIFRQRMQLNIYQPEDIMSLTFDELFPTESDNDKLKEIFQKDIDSYVSKKIIKIYQYEFPTDKIYTATKNMMTANIKKLKLPCSPKISWNILKIIYLIFTFMKKIINYTV